MNGGHPVVDQTTGTGQDDTLNRHFGGDLASPVRVTADGQVVVGDGVVYGFLCSAGTTPTISLYDGVNSSGTLVYQSPAAGETVGGLVRLPAGIRCRSGLFADVGGTTPAFTVFVIDPAIEAA